MDGSTSSAALAGHNATPTMGSDEPGARTAGSSARRNTIAVVDEKPNLKRRADEEHDEFPPYQKMRFPWSSPLGANVAYWTISVPCTELVITEKPWPQTDTLGKHILQVQLPPLRWRGWKATLKGSTILSRQGAQESEEECGKRSCACILGQGMEGRKYHVQCDSDQNSAQTQRFPEEDGTARWETLCERGQGKEKTARFNGALPKPQHKPARLTQHRLKLLP